MAYPQYSEHRFVLAGQPIYSVFVQFPIVCFTLTMVTDFAYWQTANLMWQNFSEWLLLAGLVSGGVAFLAGIVELFVRSATRSHRAIWTHALGGILVLALGFLNSLVHAGDGWTAIVPWGIALSTLTVVVMIATCWLGQRFLYRHEKEVVRHD